jgi:hypothetical protein
MNCLKYIQHITEHDSSWNFLGHTDTYSKSDRYTSKYISSGEGLYYLITLLTIARREIDNW